MTTAVTAFGGTEQVIDRLARVSSARGAGDLGERLASFERFVRADLHAFEAELAVIPRGARVVQQAAGYLLDLGGKHLRPVCVALASRLGAGFGEAARGLAVAVELVHTATLLHDDVIDVAELRRGKPTAAVVYGNAASIFAGDWLLVAALRRIGASGVEGMVDRMLATIDEMIIAESVQLERRGKVGGELREDYFKIVEGKTAALFRWAMVAGARAGGLARAQEKALEAYGLHLGVAFQAIDDELDFAASAATTGKDPLVDLREGKITYPLVVAIERVPALRERIAAALAVVEGDGEDANRDELIAIAEVVRETGALAATRKLAEEHVARALEVLAELPAGAAREALVTVALASLERKS